MKKQRIKCTLEVPTITGKYRRISGDRENVMSLFFSLWHKFVYNMNGLKDI